MDVAYDNAEATIYRFAGETALASRPQWTIAAGPWELTCTQLHSERARLYNFGTMKDLNLPRTLMGRLTGAMVLLAGLVFAALSACGGDGESGGELSRFTFTSELVAAADTPVKLAVAPDGRIFYSEYPFGSAFRLGTIRIIGADGQPLEQPFAQVAVGEMRDWGLFGLAFDPQFETNHYVYAYFIAPTPDGGGEAAIMRYTDVNNQGTDPTPILADPPRLSPDQTFHTGEASSSAPTATCTYRWGISIGTPIPKT